MAKTPNPIDSHVGARLRGRRLLAGMSQEKLGEALGITFQQIQKYEKGANRIGASRLQLAATILDVPVNYFFDGTPGEAEVPAGFAEPRAERFLDDSADSLETRRLAEAFRRIASPELRRKVLDLVETMAGPTEG